MKTSAPVTSPGTAVMTDTLGPLMSSQTWVSGPLEIPPDAIVRLHVPLLPSHYLSVMSHRFCLVPTYATLIFAPSDIVVPPPPGYLLEPILSMNSSFPFHHELDLLPSLNLAAKLCIRPPLTCLNVILGGIYNLMYVSSKFSSRF